jgi:hypothetical protein
MIVSIGIPMIFFPAHYYEKPSETTHGGNGGTTEASHELLDNSNRQTQGKIKKLSK